MAYIEMKNSYKRYQVGDTEIIANNDVNFEIEKGELVIILGASGAGKIHGSEYFRRHGHERRRASVCRRRGHFDFDENNSLTIEEMMSVSSSIL